MQNGLFFGQLQTEPFHFLSCHGTLIEICFICFLKNIDYVDNLNSAA